MALQPKYVDRPADSVAQRSRVTQDDPFPAFACMLRHTLRTRDDQGLARVVFKFVTWCTIVCRVFSWERFAPEAFDVSTLEDICVQNFARDVQHILADTPYRFRQTFSETNVRCVIRFLAHKARGVLRGLQPMIVPTMEILRLRLWRRSLQCVSDVGAGKRRLEYVKSWITERRWDIFMQTEPDTVIGAHPAFYRSIDWLPVSNNETDADEEGDEDEDGGDEFEDVAFELEGVELDVLEFATRCRC
jgi:hypothetical protein